MTFSTRGSNIESERGKSTIARGRLALYVTRPEGSTSLDEMEGVAVVEMREGVYRIFGISYPFARNEEDGWDFDVPCYISAYRPTPNARFLENFNNEDIALTAWSNAIPQYARIDRVLKYGVPEEELVEIHKPYLWIPASEFLPSPIQRKIVETVGITLQVNLDALVQRLGPHEEFGYRQKRRDEENIPPGIADLEPGRIRLAFFDNGFTAHKQYN